MPFIKPYRSYPKEPPEPAAHCWWCGEALYPDHRGCIDEIRGYACCMNDDECLEAIALEEGIVKEYREWQDSEYYDPNMTLADYTREEVECRYIPTKEDYEDYLAEMELEKERLKEDDK